MQARDGIMKTRDGKEAEMVPNLLLRRDELLTVERACPGPGGGELMSGTMPYGTERPHVQFQA